MTFAIGKLEIPLNNLLYNIFTLFFFLYKNVKWGYQGAIASKYLNTFR